ncbi:hypothetical protein MKI84_09210 [Ancylobacter sp. A5.8]|uniref:hypothetical protein n=1 Tax=Ancylobacter gelatini TaxID=2919920 RepID=UPI001F4EB200|nr:hypothetical protein [Ancylobacter gelatini]MCJ8143096.1 hypothetical protein [Ancylobacter gelatini]
MAVGYRRLTGAGMMLAMLSMTGGVTADAAALEAPDRVQMSAQVMRALVPGRPLSNDNVGNVFAAFSSLVANPPDGVTPGFATFVFSGLVTNFIEGADGSGSSAIHLAERLALIKEAVAQMPNAPGHAEMMAGLGVAFASAERNVAALAESERSRLQARGVELKTDENGRVYVDQPFSIGGERGGVSFNDVPQGEGAAEGRRYPTPEQLEDIGRHNAAIGDAVQASFDLESARLEALSTFLEDSGFLNDTAFKKSYEYLIDKTRPGPANGWVPEYVSSYYDADLITEALSAGLGMPVTSFMTPGQKRVFEDEQAAQQALAALQGEGQEQLGNLANSLTNVGPQCPRNPSPNAPCP